MRRVGVFVVLLCCAVPAPGQTMYRCSDGGKTVYQDKPCGAGAEKRIAANGGPTREDIERARMQARAEEQRAQTAARASAQKQDGPMERGSDAGANAQQNGQRNAKPTTAPAVGR